MKSDGSNANGSPNAPSVRAKAGALEGEESLGKRITEENRFEQAREMLIKAESVNSVCKAMSDLQNLAKRGHAQAMLLWSTEIFDTFQKKFYNEAKTYLHDAVRQGHPEALAFAGRWLLKGGRGVQQNIKLAREFLDRAAALGEVTALAHLSRCAFMGWGERKDDDKAGNLLSQVDRQLARNLQGKTDCQLQCQPPGRAYYESYLLNGLLYDRVNFPFLRMAAEKGDVRACFSLARRYNEGWRVPSDVFEAQKWFEKAAFRQHPLSSYEVARFMDSEAPWLAKAVSANVFQAGIALGLCFLNGNSGIPRNWREAERLFRRFCPLCPSQGYKDEIIHHFLSKPQTERSERDRRFLARVRVFLKDHDPARAACLFRTEAPAFAAECEVLAADKKKAKDNFEALLADMESDFAKAESEWQSGSLEKRIRAEDSYVKRARFFLRPKGRRFIRFIRGIAGDKPNIREIFFRCFWRAIQKTLQRDSWSVDTQKIIDWWMELAFVLYSREYAENYPPILRDAVSYCCQNVEQLQRAGVSHENIVRVHEFGGHLRNKRALTWLVQNCEDEKGVWVSIAATEKIPLALRMQADRFPSATKEQQELLREAAELGDTEAQYRQGELFLQSKDSEQAKEWFRKAAANNHRQAAMQLGQLLVLERRPDEAIQYFAKAAEAPNADLRTSAECELGKLYLQRNELATAAAHLRKAAQNHIRPAMELLVLDPTLQGLLSYEEIRKWGLVLLKTEDDGSAADNSLRGRVMTRLGLVAKNKHESADWFRKAAEAGDGPGAYEWARCLIFGDGCPVDFPAAESWLLKAWKQCKENRDGNRDWTSAISAWNGFLSAMKESEAAKVSLTHVQVENIRQDVKTDAMDTGNG